MPVTSLREQSTTPKAPPEPMRVQVAFPDGKLTRARFPSLINYEDPGGRPIVPAEMGAAPHFIVTDDQEYKIVLAITNRNVVFKRPSQATEPKTPEWRNLRTGDLVEPPRSLVDLRLDRARHELTLTWKMRRRERKGDWDILIAIEPLEGGNEGDDHFVHLQISNDPRQPRSLSLTGKPDEEEFSCPVDLKIRAVPIEIEFESLDGPPGTSDIFIRPRFSIFKYDDVPTGIDLKPILVVRDCDEFCFDLSIKKGQPLEFVPTGSSAQLEFVNKQQGYLTNRLCPARKSCRIYWREHERDERPPRGPFMSTFNLLFKHEEDDLNEGTGLDRVLVDPTVCCPPPDL